MNGLPTFTIYISPSEEDDQSYCLKLKLSSSERNDVLKEPGNKELGNAGKLNLPFPLELVPYIQQILSHIQSSDKSSEPLFKETSAKETSAKIRKLFNLKLLNNDGTIPDKVHELVGKKIGEALLKDPTFKDYLLKFYRAAREARGGNIVLIFDEETLKLAAIPWELAYYEEEPLLLYLGGDILVSCTRIIPFDSPKSSQPTRNSKPRVLIVTSYVDMDISARDLEREARRQLEEALGNSAEFDPHPLREELMLKILEKKLAKNPRADILDYYGHGSFDNGYATLAMKNDNGQRESVTASHMKGLQNLPPLIVFNACHSGQVDISNVNGSLTFALSKAGIGAVVAMQCEIQMRMIAYCITPTLYEALVEHESLPQAVARVRQRLFEQGTNEVSWFVPVLYMRDFSQAPYLPSGRIVAPPNPFLGRGAFQNAKSFVGRQGQVQEMWSTLQLGSSLLIIGSIGCGKTSMLRLLSANEEKANDELGLDKKVKIVWLPIEVKTEVDKFEKEVVQALGGKEPDTLRKLLTNKHLILLLDDLGVLDQGIEGAEFLTWLKNLLTWGVQLVVTSQETLTETFKNIPSTYHSLLAEQMDVELRLEPFSKEEARYFIRTRLKGTPFKVEQFEDLLKNRMTPRELERVCRIQYKKLCEPL
jgi:hypothetical protein